MLEMAEIITLFILISTFFVFHIEVAGSTLEKEPSKLIAVQIVYRHGNREPSSTVLGSDGLSLTSYGKNEMFKLGQYFRRRYSSFLSQGFDTKETSFISSDLDRTLQSALLFSYGLYKDSHVKANWRSGDGRRIQLDPIPIHSIPTKHDRFIQSTQACPKYDQLYTESLHAFYDSIVNQKPPNLYQDYIELIDNDLLHDPTATILDKVDVFVGLGEMVAHNLTQGLPLSPAADFLYRRHPSLPHLKALCLSFSLNTAEKQRLYSGSLLKLLLENFKENEPPKKKKLRAFTGHDRTLLGLLVTLAGWKELIPPTGASLVLELYEDEPSKLQFLEIWYRNSSEHNPLPLTISGCDHRCNLDSFAAIMSPVFPLDFATECAEEQNVNE